MNKLILNLVITACILSGCNLVNEIGKSTISSMSTEQLIQIIENPESPLFFYATEEVAKRGANAAGAASALGRALGYKRRDSYMAGIALISMGKSANSAIPYLIPVLNNDQAIARAYAAFVLGTIGDESICAIPEIAPLLWDVDPTVRGSAAVTLDALTTNNFVPQWNKIDPSTPNSIVQDFPEGSLTKDARIWWKQEGQYIEWRSNPNNCILSEN